MGQFTSVLARAAGAVVHRQGKDGVEFLLVHRPRYDDWSLPKGHLDNGESYEAAAAREVEEESGYRGTLGCEIGTIGYRTRSKQKVVRYWLLQAEKGKFKPNQEADDIRWLAPKKAQHLVSYTRDANIMRRAERLIADPKTSVVHLLRHGNAGQRSQWTEADHKRPLSRKGLRQADTVTARLLKQPITSVYSSHYVRCDQMVRPLAEKLDIELAPETSLAESEAPEDVMTFMKSLRSEAVVLCSHGGVISGVIGQLAAEGVDFGHKPRWAKASSWTLDLRKGRVLGGVYVPPPASDYR